MKNAPSGAFFIFRRRRARVECGAVRQEMVAGADSCRQKRVIKMGAARPLYPDAQMHAAAREMYAYAINSAKSAQFFRIMSWTAISEMPNLLSELVFSSYTNKTLLKSDVQPVQVVGPSS
ncbi:hypothetical protein [Cupriavidus lacunae]|uniref:hypothetical protein n=1 Tax=Cupriavidus lacunae TaxID=2666307 RepID=UPI0010589381|nr:hypothetical protein [Cupriavidus lacunae]